MGEGFYYSEIQLKIESPRRLKKVRNKRVFLTIFGQITHLSDFGMSDFHIFECHVHRTFIFQL